MKKKLLIYSDLSNKQLQHLKDIYIEKKINSMSNIELKEFVLDIISHQINNTIGKEEEMEAWGEMSDFFNEQFEEIVLEIQQKYNEETTIKETEEDSKKYRQELLERNTIEKEKKDMWDD